MRQERATPDCGEFFAGPGGEAVWQAAHRATAGVKQARLASEGLPSVDDADEIAARVAEVASRDHGDLAADAIQFGQVFAHPARDLWRVEFRFDRDPAGNDVQPAGEAQQGRQLGGSHCRLADLDRSQLFFDIGSQCHAVFLTVDGVQDSRTSGSFAAQVPVSNVDAHTGKLSQTAP